MSILGTRVARVEDPGLLTRGGVYTDDLVDPELDGALFATFVRSPIAHARVQSIDVSEARQAPGVVAVWTAADLPETPAQPPFMPAYPAQMSHPLLALDTVRYVGEQVALIVTTDRYSGEDAAELVVVDYDPLPAVVDPRAAAADERLLFPDAGTNTVIGSGLEPDPDLFEGCEVVVTREILNQRVAAASLEVRAGAAAWVRRPATRCGARTRARRASRHRSPTASAWRPTRSASSPRTSAAGSAPSSASAPSTR